MSTLLLRNADVLVTMDGMRREIAGGWLRATDGAITAVGGPGDAVAEGPADAIVDAAGCVVTPGLINTHHHLFQSLVRAVPGGQDALLFGWLKTLYPIFARMRPEDIQAAVSLGLAELALSGCTCAADHQYIYPNGARLEHSVEAAAGIGIRFHPTRGAMSIGESAGGLPPDFLTEREPDILADMERVVAALHDPAPGAMTRVGIAPCSPFTVSTGLMRDAAVLAREKGVRLHTHLAENDEDVEYSLAHYGCRPGQYAEELGWTG
ncbi:MAG: amidohydrolase family protein, partial [Pseudomonadota bacterium]